MNTLVKNYTASKNTFSKNLTYLLLFYINFKLCKMNKTKRVKSDHGFIMYL